MTARFRRKFSRQRGSGSHGWGGKKKHRGGGSQGGKGQAGMLKQKKSWRIRFDPEHFGRADFAPQEHFKTINLRDLEQGKNEFVLEGIKVLGTGKLDRAVTVKASAFSAGAKEKIEKAGGKAEVL